MVRPLDRPSERQVSRPDDDAFEDAPTDPQLPIPVLDSTDDDERVDLPPGFADVRTGPHPVTSQAAFTSLTFRPIREPWYLTNAAKLTVVALGLTAAVASLVVLLWPSSTDEPQPADTQQDAGTSAPAPTPSATPTVIPSAAPSTEPPPPTPPGPPPPPVPSADQMAPQAPRYYPPQYEAPSQKKPQVDVTRAPISVTPGITGPSAPSGSAIPGDSPKRHGFF